MITTHSTTLRTVDGGFFLPSAATGCAGAGGTCEGGVGHGAEDWLTAPPPRVAAPLSAALSSLVARLRLAYANQQATAACLTFGTAPAAGMRRPGRRRRRRPPPWRSAPNATGGARAIPARPPPR